MPNATMSALIRKREAPKPQPGLEYAALLKHVSKAAQIVFSDLLQGEVEAKARAGGSRRLVSLLAGAPDPGVYYWVTDEEGAPSLLLTMSGAFAAVLTERLLGGPLRAPEGEAVASRLEFEMAGSLVDVMVPALNGVVAKVAPGAPDEALGGKRGLVSPAAVMNEIEELEMAVIAFDLEIGGAVAASAVQALFTRSFLERQGLIEQEAGASEAGPEWTGGLKRNLLVAEIPLSAIVARIPSTVGDLSRLEIGQFLEIEDDALGGLDLVAATEKGPAIVARGRLGAFMTKKAVKLTTEVDPEFIAGL
jgi:flagellar motor switch protein FliM